MRKGNNYLTEWKGNTKDTHCYTQNAALNVDLFQNIFYHNIYYKKTKATFIINSTKIILVNSQIVYISNFAITLWTFLYCSSYYSFFSSKYQMVINSYCSYSLLCFIFCKVVNIGSWILFYITLYSYRYSPIKCDSKKYINTFGYCL